jgi:hypothetical protein
VKAVGEGERAKVMESPVFPTLPHGWTHTNVETIVKGKRIIYGTKNSTG